MGKVHEQQRRWLADELSKKGWGAKSALAERLGVRNDAITRILTEKPDRPYREISFDELVKMSDFFGSTPPGMDLLHTTLATGHENSLDKSRSEQIGSGILDKSVANTPHDATSRHTGTLIPGVELVGNRDLPVYGISPGNRGVAVLSGGPVEFASRPEPLLKVPDGYGIIVPDDSMSPEHAKGSTALVHPHLIAQAGDTCVFRRGNADGQTEFIIRKIVKITPTAWHVEQHRPMSADVPMKRSDWDECHVTVANYKRR